MRLIDADALHGELMDAVNAPFLKEMCPANWAEAYKSCVRALDRCPTLDYAPVVHGEWIDLTKIIHGQHDWHFVCSKCGFDIWDILDKTKFCGGCGAKMDGGKKDG